MSLIRNDDVGTNRPHLSLLTGLLFLSFLLHFALLLLFFSNGIAIGKEMDCIVNQMMAVAEYLGWDASELKPVMIRYSSKANCITWALALSGQGRAGQGRGYHQLGHTAYNISTYLYSYRSCKR